MSFSNVQGGWPGTGNIDADPLFVDPGAGGFQLASGSPCIDAGDNGAVPPDVTVDLDGRPRFADDPDTPDTGAGRPPIVDMGAYEFIPCTADTNGDGTVNVLDLTTVILHWGCIAPPGTCLGDANRDGVVNVSDLVEVILHWGPCS